MAETKTPREKWIDAGLRALAEGGPEAVRVEALARALEVTKGGFYWHFADREALLAEMLDHFEARGVDAVIETVERDGGDARERLRRLFATTAARGRGFSIELAIRDWARRDATVAARLRTVDNRRMEYMRSLFREFARDDRDAEVRALLTFSLFIANRFIAAEHGDHSRAEVLGFAHDWLLA